MYFFNIITGKKEAMEIQNKNIHPMENERHKFYLNLYFQMMSKSNIKQKIAILIFYFVSSEKSPKGTSKKTKSYLYNEMDTRF